MRGNRDLIELLNDSIFILILFSKIEQGKKRNIMVFLYVSVLKTDKTWKWNMQIYAWTISSFSTFVIKSVWIISFLLCHLWLSYGICLLKHSGTRMLETLKNSSNEKSYNSSRLTICAVCIQSKSSLFEYTSNKTCPLVGCLEARDR